jgi:hypothetical protein
LDHATKYCPQLPAKWQERGNHNHKPNHNVHKISVENHNEGPIITTITCRGTRRGFDVMNGGKQVEKWVRK